MSKSKLNPATATSSSAGTVTAGVAGDSLPRPARFYEKHSRLTRLAHAALALTIIVQLASSQLMSIPERGEPPGRMKLRRGSSLAFIASISASSRAT